MAKIIEKRKNREERVSNKNKGKNIMKKKKRKASCLVVRRKERSVRGKE